MDAGRARIDRGRLVCGAHGLQDLCPAALHSGPTVGDAVLLCGEKAGMNCRSIVHVDDLTNVLHGIDLAWPQWEDVLLADAPTAGAVPWADLFHGVQRHVAMHGTPDMQGTGVLAAAGAPTGAPTSAGGTATASAPPPDAPAGGAHAGGRRSHVS
jgi:hypothetical protein